MNSIGTRNRVAMAAMKRMLCRPDHETHDCGGSSDRCYRMIIPAFELLYSDLAFNLSLTTPVKGVGKLFLQVQVLLVTLCCEGDSGSHDSFEDLGFSFDLE